MRQASKGVYEVFIKHDSAWQFVTSSSGGVGVEFVAVEGGSLVFQDPAGNTASFTYGASGVGLSVGFKLPKIGKIALKYKGKTGGFVIAPQAFPNMGKLYVLENFAGDELSRSDITGVCMFVEVGGGLVVGGSATAMLLGMDPIWLPAILVSPVLTSIVQEKLMASATALLVMAGVNAGIQGGVGAAAFVGGII